MHRCVHTHLFLSFNFSEILCSFFIVVVIMVLVDVKKNIIVTITSDKGLCGGINSTSVKISKALHKLNSGNSWKTH